MFGCFQLLHIQGSQKMQARVGWHKLPGSPTQFRSTAEIS